MDLEPVKPYRGPPPRRDVVLSPNRLKELKGNGKNKSSRPEVFCKNIVLRNFAKFTGKHLFQRLFFNNVAGIRLKACNFIKKESQTYVFLWICEISKNTFFLQNTSDGCFCRFSMTGETRQTGPLQKEPSVGIPSKSLRPATLLKKRLWHRCFPVKFTKFLRSSFLQNTSGRLLLNLFTGNLN